MSQNPIPSCITDLILLLSFAVQAEMCLWLCLKVLGSTAQHWHGSHLSRPLLAYFSCHIPLAVMILMTFLSLNQMLRAKEYISLLQLVISQQQNQNTARVFSRCLGRDWEIQPCSATETPNGARAPWAPPQVCQGLQVGLGTVSFCMWKHARSQTGEEEMEEVGLVPWSARDFPRDSKPGTLSSCVSVLCL